MTFDENVLSYIGGIRNNDLNNILETNEFDSNDELQTTRRSSYYDLYKFELSKFMFDCINGKLPTPILEFFITNETIHAHHTRQRNVPHVTQTFGTISERAVTHKGPKTWTEIPQTIRLHQNKNIFSRLLKKRLHHQVQLNVLLLHRTAGNYHCSIRVSVPCMGVLWRWRCVSPRGVGVPG